jgi:phage terminase large subunit-like protein
VTGLAPVDELRALPPPLARAVLEKIAAEHGPEAVAALRWQIDAWRRPAQQIVDLSEPWTVLVITGEFGTGKTWLATQTFVQGILEWGVERPRIICATGAAIEDTVVKGPSGIGTWLPPWIPWEFQSSKGHEGLLRINGIEVSCLSADSPAQAIGSGAGWVFADDVAKWVESCGESGAERAWAAMLKSLREWPGRVVVPTTPDGAAFITSLLTTDELKGVKVLDLGNVEENRGNLSRGYLEHTIANLRAQGLWMKSREGAFSEIRWPDLRVDRPPPLVSLVVFVDPAKSSRSKSCEVGIVGVGIDARGIVYGLADRSKQMRAGEWPAAAHDLLEELQDDYRGVPSRLGIENNAGGEMGAELLRAEERRRRLESGKPGVSVIEIREVTARRNDSKVRRAGPIVALAKSGQLRMVRGLGVLEGQLSGLTDDSPGNDRADALVHGARDLAGLGEASEPDTSDAARAAFAGLAEAQRRQPRPVFRGNRV